MESTWLDFEHLVVVFVVHVSRKQGGKKGGGGGGGSSKAGKVCLQPEFTIPLRQKHFPTLFCFVVVVAAALVVAFEL